MPDKLVHETGDRWEKGMKRQTFWWIGLAAMALVVSLLISGVMPSVGAMASATSFLVAQNESEEVPVLSEPAPTVVAPYEDPQGKFQVGILDGYVATAAAGSPVFYADDGSIAYSVVRVPLESESPLSDLGLVEIAQRTLGKGEGFQTQTFNPTADGGLEIAWTGRFSQGAGAPQLVSGSIVVRQQGADAYVLAVAALPDAVNQVPSVLNVLAGTLEIL